MNVVVQHLESLLYLAQDGLWVKFNNKPRVFSDPVTAISFCIQGKFRTVRLVSNAHIPGQEIYVYPFGQDPAVKAQIKALRRAIVHNRQLDQQRKMLLARVDILRAEAKENKKQLPFKRKKLSAEYLPTPLIHD